MKKSPQLWVVGGPTASGKTGLAVQLAKQLECPVINYDSRQLYAEMKIGTARPELEELEGIPHFFLGTHSIHQPVDVRLFADEAKLKIDELGMQYENIVLAGGSGFYAQALLYGLDEMPGADPAFREQMMWEWKAGMADVLVQKLREADPLAAASMDLKNPVRVIRALEVMALTRKPFSSFHSGNKAARWSLIWLVVQENRDVLREKIALRLQQMLDRGLREEARSLFQFRHLTPLHTVGYSEWFEAWEKNLPESDVPTKILQNTMHYAKRQDTWFKKYEAIRGTASELLNWFRENSGVKR